MAGLARRASDLDLAIDAGHPLTLHERGAPRAALEESDLHYLVHVVDLNAIGQPFREAIQAGSLPLT